MNGTTRLEATLRHDRAVVIAILAAIAVLAWVYMVREANAMDRTGVCCCLGMAMSGPDVKPWSTAEILPLFLMWAEMMVAMMIPSAAPMILTFALINRKRREKEQPYAPTAMFLLGYLIVWSVFSFAAAVAQWALHGAALLTPMMVSASPWLGGALLIIAGIFQWTSWKRSCLRHCRSPLQFLMGDWREGWDGALMMGIKHGAFCAGCCWMLMALLFVAGVMNILWVAAITILVLLEKVAPRKWRIGDVAGALLVLWGGWMMASAL